VKLGVDRIRILVWLKDLGYHTLVAGDGTNDGGVLKQSLKDCKDGCSSERSIFTNVSSL
jgi:hypothetical protein